MHLSKKSLLYLRGAISRLSSVPVISMSIYFCHHHSIVRLKLGRVYPLTVLFLNYFLNLISFAFSHKFYNCLFNIFQKNLMDFLIGIVFNLKIKLERVDILTVLSIPIHDHRISFHLFSSADFFTNVL